MHEVLLLGIAASELTVLLTSDPRRWSRRLSIFLTLLLAVICYSWFILGVSALANAIGATLALVWFAWDLVDPSARGVLARWALASVGFVALLSLDPLNFPLLSLRSGRPIDLIIAVLFLVTGPVNHLITSILQCARGRASGPVPGWINAPVLPAMPDVTLADDGEGEEGAEVTEVPVTSGALPVLGAQVDEEEVTALRVHSNVCSSSFWPVRARRLLSLPSLLPRASFVSLKSRRIRREKRQRSSSSARCPRGFWPPSWRCSSVS